MAIPTRMRILDYLRREQTASVGDLARTLNLTGADIRHHLAILVETEMVEAIGPKRGARGRPVQVYRLARRFSGDNLGQLAGALLAEWLEGQDPAAQQEHLQRIAGRLSSLDPAAVDEPFPRRLAGAVARLNRLHYQARWEATAAGPRLLLGNCPYAAIVGSHPELCILDRALLQDFLGVPVRQIIKLQPNEKGLPYCEFLVGSSG